MANSVRRKIVSAYAAGLLTAGVIGLASSPDAAVAPGAANAAEGLLTQLSNRSPGIRTADQLTKTTDIQVASRVTPVSHFVSAVPEPETWAMMLVGFGFIGLSLRWHGARRGSEAAKA